MIAGRERHVLEQLFDHRVEATRADVLGFLVHRERDFREAPDAVVGEFDFHFLGAQQRLVLPGQAGIGAGQDALEIGDRQRFQFDPDREAALQLRDQVGRLGQMERAGSDEQDMVGAGHAVLGIDRGAFDQQQQVALHAGARDIGAADFGAGRDLVDLVEEYDAVLFDVGNRFLLQLLFAVAVDAGSVFATQPVIEQMQLGYL